MHPAIERNGDLDGQRGGRAEAIQPQPEAGSRRHIGDARHAAQAQRAIADHAATQQRRGVDVAEAVRDADAEVGHGSHEPRVAAVAVITGERGLRTQVLPVHAALRASRAAVGQPRHAGAVADIPTAHVFTKPDHPTNHLVTGHDRQPMGRQVALDDLQVGPTHGARLDLEQQFARAGSRLGPIHQLERALANRAGLGQNHRRVAGHWPPAACRAFSRIDCSCSVHSGPYARHGGISTPPICAPG